MPQPPSSSSTGSGAGAALQITKYCTRPFAGNAIHAPVHVFAARHDPRRLDPNAKRHLTTTLYPSLSKPGVDGYQVLLASSNELVSEHVEHLSLCPSSLSAAVQMEVVPLATAKHMAEMMGIGLVVASAMYCDVATCETWWDLYYFMPNPASRASMSRQMLQ